MLEMLFVVAITGVIAAIAVPMMANTMGFLHLDGDARDLRNTVSLARMQAAANFVQARVFVDTSVNGYHIELQNGAGWAATQAGITYLSTSSESYSFGVVSASPPNTQGPILQAPACLNNANPPTAIANTRCIVFNSRGIPIDNTGAPVGTYALYLTDGSAVYGVTVSATSSIKLWRTQPTANPAWVQQ